ncbi:cell division control protein 45-like protein [Hibiscus syriacus]|uniref:Cell division control protein 45-like protein n=1 Tax=Hibiscus syriacus TaxID=106335 RepID=A0A6A3ALZ2_HIBSY|nr:cell division control protein 45-like protein [Hibiscus syriacus]
MNTIETRVPSLRGYRHRKIVLDLNVPPCDIREQADLEEVVSYSIEPVPPDTIDVEAIEDDVIESSATAFAEAKNNSRSSSRGTVMDVDSGRLAWSTTNNQNKRRRLNLSQTVINCDQYINLESTPQSIVKEIIELQPPQRNQPSIVQFAWVHLPRRCRQGKESSRRN